MNRVIGRLADLWALVLFAPALAPPSGGGNGDDDERRLPPPSEGVRRCYAALRAPGATSASDPPFCLEPRTFLDAEAWAPCKRSDGPQVSLGVASHAERISRPLRLRS